MRKLNLFFSWQSDVGDNHAKMRRALIDACTAIKEEGEYDITYTESTWDRSGSPMIENAVMEKAKGCDIFVADITPVATIQKKELPNPNVMLELGIAKSCLVDDVILLLYTGEINANSMPFDINHQRMSRFSKSAIIEYVKSMAEMAVKNPKHTSIFDKNDRFLYYDRNVKKNIASGKYLPNVYLDNREIKQHLRDFVSPYLFCKLVLERCDMMDVYRINRNRRFLHKEPFVFDVSEFKNLVAEEHTSDFYRRARELKGYLNGKYIELHGNNSEYLRSSKYGKQVTHLEYIISKVLLITTSAGQGKTNLICDLVDNVLLKRKIPFVYLNGYEIDAEGISESFVKAMLPTSKVSFDEAMQSLATYCRYKRTPVILIIDGLNENPRPSAFSRSLEFFMDAVLQYDCVKVIMTCRTEYYAECFSLFDSVFKDRMIKIENLNQCFNDNELERLLDNYLRYFNVSAQLDDNIKKKLCEDLLLLRIFCEANQNKSLGLVHSIKREELFTEYYERIADNLISRVREEENYQLSSSKVKKFMMRLIEYMIANNQFFNVPLSFLEERLNDEEKRIFSRFLDDNILIRKDLTPESKGLFGRNEVVNFTYDAFRDYLLSSYLSDFIYEHDRQLYERCIVEYTVKGHQLREGITPFLFVRSKLNNNEDAIKFLKSFDWYEPVFEDYIWDVPEENINSDDIDLVIRFLSSDEPSYVAENLIFYGRWNESEYTKLNIRVLLDYLSTLNDEALLTFMERVWSDKPVRGWGLERNEEKTERIQMIESLEHVLDDEKVCANEHFHNLFELLLYIAICSREQGFNAFRKYLIKYKPLDMLNRVLENTKSDKLVLKIEEMKKML